jgi:hypothetical protein
MNGSFSSPSPWRTDTLTHVELTWIKRRVEHALRFGRSADERIIDATRRVVSFAPGSVFAFLRWASSDLGVTISRLDIVRAVAPGRPLQALPFVKPGGEILLRVDTWPTVERVLQAIDAIETLGIDPADAAPDYWRHLHHRLAAGHEPRRYTRERHTAWLRRRSAAP